jgi:hypothetical protein
MVVSNGRLINDELKSYERKLRYYTGILSGGSEEIYDISQDSSSQYSNWPFLKYKTDPLQHEATTLISVFTLKPKTSVTSVRLEAP